MRLGGLNGQSHTHTVCGDVINFGAWGVVNSVIHGDAINGKVEHGKYYVAMKGQFTGSLAGRIRVQLRSYVFKFCVVFGYNTLWAPGYESEYSEGQA